MPSDSHSLYPLNPANSTLQISTQEQYSLQTLLFKLNPCSSFFLPFASLIRLLQNSLSQCLATASYKLYDYKNHVRVGVFHHLSLWRVPRTPTSHFISSNSAIDPQTPKKEEEMAHKCRREVVTVNSVPPDTHDSYFPDPLIFNQ